MAHPQCSAERPQIDVVYWDSQHTRQKRWHQESGQLDGVGTATGLESVHTARVLQNDLQQAPAAWNLSDQLSKRPWRRTASTCAHSLAPHSWIGILRAGSHCFHSCLPMWHTCWGRACPPWVKRERKALVQLPVNFDLNESPFPVLFIVTPAAGLPPASSFKDSSDVTVILSSSEYLSKSFIEGRSHLGPFKKEDNISQSHICEATDTLLARAQADLSRALPHHVEESLHFLRDRLMSARVDW